MTFFVKWILKISLHFCFFSALISIHAFAAHTSQKQLVFATQAKPPLSLYLKDIMQEALAPHGIKVDVLEMPGNRVISEVNKGRFDGDLARVNVLKSISDVDTSNYLRVNELIFTSQLVVITRAQTILPEVITWKTINLQNVAYVRGSQIVKQNLNLKNSISVTSAKQALEMVASRRVDATILLLPVANNLLAQFPNLNEKLKVQKPALMPIQLFSYLHKKHEKLLPLLELSLQNMKKNNIFDQLALKHNLTPPFEFQNLKISKIKETKANSYLP